MKKSILCVLCISLLFSISCRKNPQCITSIASASNDPVFVVINGQAITESELEKSLSGGEKGQFLKVKANIYNANMAFLEEFVFQRLVEVEAKKKNLTPEKYLKMELDQKIKPVKDKDIQDFYSKVKHQLEQGGQKIPPLDEVKPKINQQLTMENTSERRSALNEELLKKNSVTFGFKQPRIEVQTGDRPFRGVQNAKVTIIEFSDFQCPYCKKGSATMEEVMKKYPTKVKYYFRDYPLPFHDRAKNAANASRCANEQGKFWEFHDKVFENQNKLADDDLISIGKNLNLDMAKFEPCVKEIKMVAEIEKDQLDGDAAGVSGTPAYFINGIFLNGAVPSKKFEEIINQELKK